MLPVVRISSGIPPGCSPVVPWWPLELFLVIQPVSDTHFEIGVSRLQLFDRFL